MIGRHIHDAVLNIITTAAIIGLMTAAEMISRDGAHAGYITAIITSGAWLITYGWANKNYYLYGNNGHADA